MIAHGSRIILPDEWRWMPWRNGGGRTAEIHVEGTAAAPDWRLSLAIIERDGPFSAWPGMDRALVWLDGGRLDLDIGGERRCLDRPGERAEFAGEDIVHASVAGRTTVLNLMVRRGPRWRMAGPEAANPVSIVHARSSASFVAGGEQLELPAQATLITHDVGKTVVGAEPLIILHLLRLPLPD